MEDLIYIIRAPRNLPLKNGAAHRNLFQKQTPQPPTVQTGQSRERVLNVLKQFREKRAEILRSRKLEHCLPVNLNAFGEIKQKLRIGNADYIGAAPGVLVGDLLEARVELVLAGVDGKLQNGIDFTTFKGRSLATCIVSKFGYRDKMNDPNYIVYGGEGGNSRDIGGGKKKKKFVLFDQKMKKGNLALKNSMEVGNDVRVLRGVQDPTKRAGSAVYVYDGLYNVVDCMRKKGDGGDMVFDFYLKRKPGQKGINWNNYK